MPRPDDELAENLIAVIAAFRRRAWKAAGGGTTQDIRKARVAARRARTILRMASAPELEALKPELAELASALGRVRDLDVQIAALGDEGHAATSASRREALEAIVRHLERERRAESRLLAALVAEPRFRRLGVIIDRLVAVPPELDVRSGDQRIAQVRRRYRSARAHGDAIGPDSAADAYHDLRIAIKRLRYTLEVTDPDPEALRVLRGLQDVLGEHQDACVAETRLRELAAGVELAEGVRPEVVRIADERGELAASLRAAFPEPYAAFRRRRPPT